MNYVANITTTPTYIELDFSIMSVPEVITVIEKEAYAKSAFACFKYKKFVEPDYTFPIVVVFPSSSVFKPAQMIGIAEADQPPVIRDENIVLIRNWNGVAVTSALDLYNRILSWYNS